MKLHGESSTRASAGPSQGENKPAGAAAWSKRLGRIAAILIFILAILIATVWASLALSYRLPAPDLVRNLVAILFALLGLSAIIGLIGRLRPLAPLCFVLAFGAVLIWWGTIKPPAHADWAPDVARQVTGKVDGDTLTLTDVRNFQWHPDSSFSENWTTRTYDLSKLKTLDLFMSYWAGPQMAHVIMSFGFQGGDYLAWSIEVRRREGGEFSPIADLFKSNPLVILAADERDVVRVRSNVRGEDVQLFRLRTPPDAARRLLLEYVADANSLADRPQFYNSITTNCTTTIVKMVRATGAKIAFDWRLIVNGYLPEFMYQRGALDTRVPFDALKAAAHIDARAREAGDSAEFSQLIRVGVPSPHDP